nr:hypothetical protein Hi04_10k_c962_00023 [uncultured bacterium]
MWRVLARIFFVAGALGLLNQLWTVSADLYARHTWRRVDGKIVASDLEDDKAMPGKIGADKRYTNYWLSYGVRFAVAEGQCQTRLVYGGPPSSLPCYATVRTRSTRSPHEAWEWQRNGYRLNQPVEVLYESAGPAIKIADEPIWLRYRLDHLMLAVLWVLGFAALNGFVERRLQYFTSHPAAERVPRSNAPDEYGLTSLELS